MTTTEYHVITRYMVDDKAAAKKLSSIQREAQATGLKVQGIGAQLKWAFGAAAGAGALALGKRALVDLNSELEQSRIQMAGLLQLNMGGTFEANMGRAQRLVKGLQQDAKSSVGTTKEFVQMASMLAGPISKAGLSMADLRTVSAGATVAAKAMGVEAGDAARDLEQALAGTLTKQERFARNLIEPMGFSPEKFNQLDAAKRAATLVKAFQQQALQDMAKAQGESFAGVISTLQDGVEMAFGRAGLPLVKAITREVATWNQWLEKNQDTVDRWADEFGQTLVQGLTSVKEAAAFIVEHKDLLMTLAKAWLMGKVVGGIAGSASNLVGGISQQLATLGQGFGGAAAAAGETAKGLSGASAGLAKFAGQLQAAGAIAQLGVMAITAYSEHKEKELRKDMDQALLTSTARLEGKRVTKDDFHAAKMSQLSEAQKRRAGMIASSLFQNQETRGMLNMHDEKKLRAAILSNLSRSIGDDDAKKWFSMTDADRQAQVERARQRDREQDTPGLNSYKTMRTQMQADEEFAETLAEANNLLRAVRFAWAAGAGSGIPYGPMPAPPGEGEEETPTKKHRTDVKIDLVQVAAPDPDRVVLGIAKAVERYNRNPTQPRQALREGGF
jgi:hypothetical protein